MEHIITVHGERMKCNECDKTFSSKTNLRIHEKNKHEDGDNNSALNNIQTVKNTDKNCTVEFSTLIHTTFD